MQSKFMEKVTYFVAGALLSVGAFGVSQAKDAAPAPETLTVTDLEDSQLSGYLKDFHILQLEFNQRVDKIKRDHGWGDDVYYDANQNKFFRAAMAVPKKPAEKAPDSK